MIRAFFCCIALLLCAGCDDAWTAPADWQTIGRHVVAFSYDDCRQCQVDKPQLRQLEARGISVVHVDRHEHPELVASYGVTRYPSYLVVEDGEVKARSVSLTAIMATLKALGWIIGFIL